jgi:HSP20 family molecular chaperone IbpA
MDLSLQIEGQTLVFRLEKNTPNQGGMYQDSGPWSGSVQIPEDGETKRTSAKFTDGVLSVTIPKHKKAKPIEVRIS